MRFERLTSERHPLFSAAMNLYAASFPSHEQREPASQARILSDPEYHFELIMDGETFVGLILFWETDAFIYIEHFCICPELRNRQYGFRALRAFCECGKTVILEIDPPEDEISIRRRGFYERCGFCENPFSHVHPPYHAGNAGHSLVLVSYPRAIAQSECEAFQDYLRNRVMRGAF